MSVTMIAAAFNAHAFFPLHHETPASLPQPPRDAAVASDSLPRAFIFTAAGLRARSGNTRRANQDYRALAEPCASSCSGGLPG